MHLATKYFNTLKCLHVPAYLDAAGENAGSHLLVETGVLLTIADDVTQLGNQQQVGAMLVQSFDQSVLGPHTTHHYCVIFVKGRQAVQKADELLQHLHSQSQEVKRCVPCCGCVLPAL